MRDKTRNGNKEQPLRDPPTRIWLSVCCRGLVQSRGSIPAVLYHDRGGFCIEAVEEALARHRTPDIFNADQGSQFTSIEFTAVLHRVEIAISIDGNDVRRYNVFVEQLWRSIKYEEVYLHAYDTVSEARVGIGRYLTFYDSQRPHRALYRQTPAQAYFNGLGQMKLAT